MIVIPMAGLSSRFSRAGYDKPKWMLPLAGRPLLDWSLLGFSGLFAVEEFLIIYRETGGVGEFIRCRTNELGIAAPRLVALDAPTRGQAETVQLGLEKGDVPAETPITIFNIDTIRPGYAHSPRLAGSAGWLECFMGHGTHWSFVEEDLDHPGVARRVVEKQRISSNCCTGMYYFASRELFDTAYAAELAQPSAAELFVAPLYQRLIDANLRVTFDVISPEAIFFSGTPEEYVAALCQTSALQRSFSHQLRARP